jgi:acyl-CoA thioesterase FadM
MFDKASAYQLQITEQNKVATAHGIVKHNQYIKLFAVCYVKISRTVNLYNQDMLRQSDKPGSYT